MFVRNNYVCVCMCVRILYVHIHNQISRTLDDILLHCYVAISLNKVNVLWPLCMFPEDKLYIIMVNVFSNLYYIL